MRRAIVTGGAGFIGANVARRLLEDGVETYLFTLPESRRWRFTDIEESVSVVEVDLADGEGVAAAVASVKPDWVFHLAAHGGYSWQTDWSTILRANVLGTANLLEASLRAGFETFVNTGSSSEYGLKRHPPTEDESIEPNSAYAVAKAAATMLCRQAAHCDGANVCTLRLYSTYGPWEEPLRLVPALAVEGLNGRLPPLVEPSVARDFVWVGDIVEAYLAAAKARHAEAGAVYNVGTGVQTTIAEAVEIVRNVLGIETAPEWGSMPARSWDTDCWVADNSKVSRVLGWRPTRSFQDGFSEFATWLEERPSVLDFYAKSRG